ncbi:MAG: hypothetical protein Kow0025_01120 [Thermodesulfovibrionales bacterium]
MRKFISIGLISIVIFFVGSLLRVMDVAPGDFSPGYKKQVSAVGELREHKLVLASSQAIELRTEDGEETPYIKDDETVKTLAELIKEFSAVSPEIDLGRVIGVGYSSIRLPLGKQSVDALNPVYVVLAPEKGDSSRYLAVGDLSDLGAWLDAKHQKSLTSTALALITAGFILQLSENLWLLMSRRRAGGEGQAA